MTALFAEILIGRPSSTSVIGFRFIPIYALILMVLSYGAGFLVKLVLGMFVSVKVLSDKASRVLLLTFHGTLAISFISAWGFAAWEGYQQRPKVIFDTGRVKQVGPLSPKVEKIEGKLVLSIYGEDPEKREPVVWNGKEVKFTRDGNVLKIERINGGELVPADLRKYDYISRVFAIPVRIASTDDQALAVIARLRPTSGRAVFLVYDLEGKLVYQEFIKCHGLKGLLSLARDEAGKEYLNLNLETPSVITIDYPPEPRQLVSLVRSISCYLKVYPRPSRQALIARK
jgi:hypothetical protein